MSEAPAEAGAREALLDLAFGGKKRRRKTSERLREYRLPAEGLSLSAKLGNGRLVGTLRLWHIAAGESPALLLGPLAVHPAYHNRGIGSLLMQEAIGRARALGHRAVILVGDELYYRRFGFSNALTAELRMPGPFERHRLLALELVPGALANARGLIKATGEMAPIPAEKSTGIAGKSLTSRVRRAS